MIPKVAKQTQSEKDFAYMLATDRDKGICQRCLRAEGTNRDHRKNRSQGGRTTPANLQLLCGSGTTGCHGWVTEHPRQAVDTGWAVPSWADPEHWPAARWIAALGGVKRSAFVLYDDDGGWREITRAEAMERMGRNGQ